MLGEANKINKSNNMEKRQQLSDLIGDYFQYWFSIENSTNVQIYAQKYT